MSAFTHFSSAQTQRGASTDAIFIWFSVIGAENGATKVSPPCFYQAMTFNTLYFLIKRGTRPGPLRQPRCSLLAAPAACRHRSHPRAADSTPPLPAQKTVSRKTAFFTLQLLTRVCVHCSNTLPFDEGGLKKFSDVSFCFICSQYASDD